jgi:hypothetical protein
MLEDALTDRDLVHRQAASVIVKHIALGVAGIGCEDYDAPDESCLAKLLRNVATCHWCCHHRFGADRELDLTNPKIVFYCMSYHP